MINVELGLKLVLDVEFSSRCLYSSLLVDKTLQLCSWDPNEDQGATPSRPSPHLATGNTSWVHLSNAITHKSMQTCNLKSCGGRTATLRGLSMNTYELPSESSDN